jgi:uncharacterized protein GlcG (DUF336 family)
VEAAEREDGASIGRFDIAYGKAHGAIALGIGSRAIMSRAEQRACRDRRYRVGGPGR